MILSAIIGSISFAGSLVAFAKLQELIGGRPIVYPGQKFVNALVIAVALVLAAAILAGPESQWLLVGVIVAALTFGVLFVLPIGGADMPVVISLLNAFTGLAASAAGFVLHENVLIVSGALVGASGTLLTLLMGRAMNRSIANVLFGAFGQIQTGTGAALEDGRTARSTTPDDVAIMLSYARRVVFVPGYGLAVAQAQHDVRALGDLLEEKGVDVRYAIHPVAGRMPGHMNVLLAEANVPYDKLYEMDEINPELPQTDVVVVVGANDVVNPAARNDTTSPIYGMPIIDVDKAAQVVVVKRSLAPGFAGIDNPLFYDENDVDAVRRREGGVRAAARVREEPLAAWSRSSRPRHVEAAVPPERAYEAVRTAFVAHARGEWTMQPKLYVTNYPAGDFRAMPALGGGHALLKWVTSFPGNPARGLPTVSGVVILSNAETGVVEAVLDAGSVTALRTGAAAALAAETLGVPGGSAAVIGAGVNGRACARSLKALGRDVALWDVDGERAHSVAAGLGVGVAASREEALAADVVVTVTPGKQILLPEGSLRPGQHVSLMGADGPGKAEIAVEEIRRARDLLRRVGAGEPRRRAGRRGRGGRDHARRRDRARRGADRRGGGAPLRRRDHDLRLDRPRDPGSRDRDRRVRARAASSTCLSSTSDPALGGW